MKGFERFRIWYNVYQRIRFFKRMYPLPAIAKDLVLFPLDYAFDHFIRMVRNVTLAITHKCNLRCQMCYFQQELKNICELPLSVFKYIIGSVKRSSPCIILSGGEPLMHPTLIDMVSYAKEARLAVQIFTNGTLVQPKIADSLVKVGLDYINFTLLGNEESHSQIARIPDTYERFINNLEYFAAHRGKIRVVLNYTITPKAIKDIDHAVELVKRYKLDGLRIQHYNFLLPREFGAQEQVVKRLFGKNYSTREIEAGEEVSSTTRELIEFKKGLAKKMSGIPVQWAPTLTTTEIENWYSTERFRTQRKCLYPWRGIFIDADGKIYPCSKMCIELGRVQEQGVLDIWNSARMQKVRTFLKRGLFPACSRCCKL